MQFYGGVDDGRTNLSIILSDTYLNGQYEPFVSKAAAMAYLILDQRFCACTCTCMCNVVMCMLLHRDKKKKPEVCLPYIEVSARISENLLISFIRTRPMGGFV